MNCCPPHLLKYPNLPNTFIGKWGQDSTTFELPPPHSFVPEAHFMNARQAPSRPFLIYSGPPQDNVSMTLQAGIFGYPIAHSISPAMHQAALDHAGIDATYDAWETPLNALAHGVSTLRGDDYLGAKRHCPTQAGGDGASGRDRRPCDQDRCVNTIVNDDGRLTGIEHRRRRIHRLAQGRGPSHPFRAGRRARRRRGRGARRGVRPGFGGGCVFDDRQPHPRPRTHSCRRGASGRTGNPGACAG